MTQPQFFRQAGVPWQIIWNSDASFEKDFRGRTIYDKYEVHIDVNLSLEAQRSALLHELLHICSDVVLVGDEQLSEHQIRVLANNFFEILYHNREIGDYLVSG